MTGQTYRVGAGNMVDGLDDAVRGLSAGESATFSTTLVGAAEGEAADVTVTVARGEGAGAARRSTTTSPSWPASSTRSTEMRDDVRTRLERVTRGEQLVKARDQVLDAYLDRADVPVPARMLEHELEHRNEAVAARAGDVRPADGAVPRGAGQDRRGVRRRDRRGARARRSRRSSSSTRSPRRSSCRSTRASSPPT